MKEYEVVIKNSVGCVVLNERVKAENENKAIKSVLDFGAIYSGDKIEIEEV
jgi:hypothetical protein